MTVADSAAPAVTREIIRRTRAYRMADLPAAVIELARHCLLDYLAVALAGANEPVVDILMADIIPIGPPGNGTIIGRSERLGLYETALVNGTIAHALDYDDFNASAGAHTSSTLITAALALAEHHNARGAALIEALVTGYEVMGRVGQLVRPDQAKRGFHTTGTLGTIGAAAVAARLMELDEERTAHAYGMAATLGAGLIASFGTMAKPIHAGRAASTGIQAARLAARGLVARPDILEAPRGFVRAHGDTINFDAALADQPGGFHLFAQVFKYYASCGPTHPAVDAALRIRQRAGHVDGLAAATLRTGMAGSVCNIPSPRTGLELKFSLRGTVAMALAGVDMADPLSFTDASANDPALSALRERITVELRPGFEDGHAELEIAFSDGRRLTEQATIAPANDDLARQGQLLSVKARRLASRAIGEQRAEELIAKVRELQPTDSIRPLMRLVRN